ncbi:MAG: hypothetical protein ACRD09_00685 [Vicinamibacterales bacterium]
MPRVPSIAGVLTLAAGAALAGAIFGLTFVLEGRARDAAHGLERQTAIVADVGRLVRAVDLMMAIPRALPGVRSEDLVREHAGRRREYEDALERVKRLAAAEADSGAASRAATIERSLDDWQRAVTVPLLQGRQGPGQSEDGIARAARVRDELRALEADAWEVLGTRRSAVERIAGRERMLGRWLAAAVAVGLVVVCALRWRAAWSGAPS